MPSETFAFLANASAAAGIPLWLLLFIIVWSLLWKGLAWWRAARRGHLLWFVAFFVINTLGILEILYVFLFSKLRFAHLSAGKRARARKKSRASLSLFE